MACLEFFLTLPIIHGKYCKKFSNQRRQNVVNEIISVLLLSDIACYAFVCD